MHVDTAWDHAHRVGLVGVVLLSRSAARGRETGLLLPAGPDPSCVGRREALSAIQ